MLSIDEANLVGNAFMRSEMPKNTIIALKPAFVVCNGTDKSIPYKPKHSILPLNLLLKNCGSSVGFSYGDIRRQTFPLD